MPLTSIYLISLKGHIHLQMNPAPIKKKPILFVDFHGVLSYKPFWFSLQDTAHPLHNIFAPIQKYLLKDNPSVFKDWMHGHYTSEEIHDILSREVNDKFDRDELFKIFIKDCENLDISKKILDYLEQMKNSYHLIITTDNADSFNRFTLPANPRIKEIFDDVSNSCNVGYSKKDHNCILFHSYIKKYKADPTQCILLDDSPRNCSSFEKHTNGKAIQVNSETEVLNALVGIKKGFQELAKE